MRKFPSPFSVSGFVTCLRMEGQTERLNRYFAGLRTCLEFIVIDLSIKPHVGYLAMIFFLRKTETGTFIVVTCNRFRL